ALRGDGTVWSWGRNNTGQLGDGSTFDRNAPVQVSGLSNIMWVDAGNDHSLALDQNGTLWAWGNNSHGRLGDGTTSNSNVPVEVEESTWNGHAIHTMAGGGQHSLGIIEYMGAPVFFSWGRNNYGQLGLGKGSLATSSNPIMISIAIDSDNDGLFDYEEFLYGFDPLNPDTTGTGLGDSLILSLGLDPNNDDWNGNGVSNANEIARGTNPFPSVTLPGYDPTFPLYPTLSDLGEPDPGDTDPPFILLQKPPEAILQ
ncbi:MAG: hypothetical protein LAT58_13995, partial [Opitutales bacterium]|nr:hypothetical protein [Opitutales bacterium]